MSVLSGGSSWTYPKTILPERGFRLGFRSTLPMGAGCFCTVDLNLYGHILGTALSQRFGLASMKPIAHLNLQYKT